MSNNRSKKIIIKTITGIVIGSIITGIYLFNIRRQSFDKDVSIFKRLTKSSRMEQILHNTSEEKLQRFKTTNFQPDEVFLFDNDQEDR